MIAATVAWVGRTAGPRLRTIGTMRFALPGFAAAMLWVTACASDSGIVVEVAWDAAAFPEAETLRIYVGTGDPARATVDEASIAEPMAGVTSPYRYLLRPDGALGEIGPLVLAAGLTKGDPPQAVAFDVYPEAVAFADGEVRTIRLTLEERAYLPGGPTGTCAIYADDLGGTRTIGLPGDADCDGSPDEVDCAALDPLVSSDDLDRDGFTCADDCLEADGPVPVGPLGRMIDPASVHRGQDIETFRAANQIPDHRACLRFDFDCSGRCGDEAPSPGSAPVEPDPDGSGADECGLVARRPTSLVCPEVPTDCEPETAGDTSTATSEGERCDGRDTDCDGRPATAIVCAEVGAVGACKIGSRACDDNLGLHVGGCALVAELDPADLRACSLVDAVAQCRYEEDPLGCAADRAGTNDLIFECGVSACDAAEGTRLPGLPIGEACTWRVVGGTAQGDWDVGFFSMSGVTMLADTIVECGPNLHARPKVENPRPYTVMVIGRRGLGLIESVRVIELKPDSNACDGRMDCTLL